jgi:MFS family permease
MDRPAHTRPSATGDILEPAVLPTPPELALDSPRAWLMAATAFVTCMVVFGVAYSFGAFFKPMATEFGASRAGTSAFFAITAGLYNLLGVVSGRLADRYGPRPILLIGAVAMAFGLIATSFIHHLWIGYFTYGIGVGIGVAFTYIPMLSVVGGWFDRHRTSALGIAVSGIGAGTLIVTPSAAALIARVGWRESYVLMGVAATVLIIICAFISAPAPVHIAAGKFYVTSALRTSKFILLYISSMLSSIAIYVPFVYLPAFAHDHGASEVSAAALVGFIGAASIAGRLGLATFADWLGIIPLYKACTLIMGLSFGLWAVSGSYANTYAWLVIFAIVMGSSYGGMIALSPAVVAELFGVQGLGATLGALYTGSAVSALAGPPIAGFVIDHSSYLWAAIFAGSTAVLGYLILIPMTTQLRLPTAAVV